MNDGLQRYIDIVLYKDTYEESKLYFEMETLEVYRFYNKEK